MKKLTRFLALFFMVFCITLIGSQTIKAAGDYYIKVNKGTNTVTVYKNDGTPYKAMICSCGEATPIGTFYTPEKYRWKLMVGNCYAQYATRITSGYLFHSVWYYKEGDKSTMSVAAYNKMGTTTSLGCVRLLMKDSKWVYDNCPVGTKVVIFNGTKKDDPLGKPSFMKINDGSFTNWEPTDPDSNNPWKKTKPTITVTGSLNVEYGSKFNPFSAVTVKDSGQNIITDGVKVIGKVDTSELGTYKVKYKVKDILGHKAVKTIKYKVVSTKKPIISGAKKRTVTRGIQYNLLNGVKARAVIGTNLTSKIKVYVRNLSTNKLASAKNGLFTFKNGGKYRVTYKVKDTQNGKTTRKSVIYKVIDKRVTLKTKSITLEYGADFDKYAGVISLKSYKGTSLSISKNVTVYGASKVNTSVLGTYKIKYVAMQSKKAYTKVKKTIAVNVVDTKLPTISGAASATVDLNKQYNLLDGVTATAATGADLTDKISVSVKNLSTGTVTKASNGYITFKKANKFNVIYTVTGTNKKTRTVTVVYNVIDTHVLLETQDINIECGDVLDPYAGIVSLTSYDGIPLDITSNVTITGVENVNTSVTGTYSLTYTATQNAASWRSVTKTVNVYVKDTQEMINHAIAAATSNINSYYNNLQSSDYSSSNWTIIESYYSDALIAVANAESAAQAQSIYNEFVSNVLSVETIEYGSLV
ncbi:MAG: immunoglobulin-like domain-containing protein [Eubacterium sp.]